MSFSRQVAEITGALSTIGPVLGSAKELAMVARGRLLYLRPRARRRFQRQPRVPQQWRFPQRTLSGIGIRQLRHVNPLLGPAGAISQEPFAVEFGNTQFGQAQAARDPRFIQFAMKFYS
jgi:hypothetical protein